MLYVVGGSTMVQSVQLKGIPVEDRCGIVKDVIPPRSQCCYGLKGLQED